MTGERRSPRPFTVLPRSLSPLHDESLPGYLLRLAHRTGRTPHRLAKIIGLFEHTTGEPADARILALGPQTAATFARVTQLAATEVADLGLAGLTARYPPLDPHFLGRSRSGRMVTSEPWIFGRWSRYCPECLAGDGSAIQQEHGGAWQRLWRLPPVFSCTAHHRLLAAICPECRQPAATVRAYDGSLMVGCPAQSGLYPAQCRNYITGRGWRTAACGARLDQNVAAVVVPPRHLLTLQRRLVRLLDPQESPATISCGAATDAGHYFVDLRLLTNLICVTWPTARGWAATSADAAVVDQHVAERRDRIEQTRLQRRKARPHEHYDRPPADSYACASLLALADRVLNAEATVASELLSQLIGGPATAGWALHFLSAHPYCSPGMQAAAEPHVTAYRRRPRTGRPAQSTLGPAVGVPSAFGADQ